MKRTIALLICLLLAMSLFGCGTEEADQPEDTGAAGHPEEVADTTRLDSAIIDAAAEVEAAVEEAIKEEVENP